MKLLIKLWKCQNKNCDKKAEYSVAEFHGFFCKQHYDMWKFDVEELRKYVRKQDECPIDEESLR